MGNHRVGARILRPRSLFLRLMNCWFCTRLGFHVKYIRHCHPWFMAVLIKSSCCSGVHEASSCSLTVPLFLSVYHPNLNKYIYIYSIHLVNNIHIDGRFRNQECVLILSPFPAAFHFDIHAYYSACKNDVLWV